MQSLNEYRLAIVDINNFNQAIEDQSIYRIFFSLDKNPALWRWYTGQLCEIVDAYKMESKWMTILGTDLVKTFRGLLSMGEKTSTIINYIFNHNILLQNWYSALAIPDDLNGKHICSKFIDLVSDFHLALSANLDNIIVFMWSRIPYLRQWYGGMKLSVLNDESITHNASIQLPNLINAFKLASKRHPEIANTMLNGLLVLYSQTILENPIIQLSIINEVFDKYRPEEIENHLTIRFLKLINDRGLLQQVKKCIQFGLNYKTVYKEEKIVLITDRLIELDEEVMSDGVGITPTFQSIEKNESVPMTEVSSAISTKTVSNIRLVDPKVLLREFRQYLRNGNRERLINLWYAEKIEDFYRHDSIAQQQLITFEELITDFRLTLKIGSKLCHEIWKLNQKIREYYSRDSNILMFEIYQMITDFRLALDNEAVDMASTILNKLPIIGLLYYSESLGYYRLSLSNILQDIVKAFKLNIEIFINILLANEEKFSTFLQKIEYSNAYIIFTAVIDSDNENKEKVIEFFGERLHQMKIQYNSTDHQVKKLTPIGNQMTVSSTQSDDKENQSTIHFSNPTFNYQTNINVFNFTFLSPSVSQSSKLEKEKEEITNIQLCQDGSEEMNISFTDYLTEEDYLYIDSICGTRL